MIFCYAASIIALAFAVVFFTGRGASYVKGYTQLSDDEKQNIRIGALCRNMGVMFLITALFFAVTAYSETFRTNYFRYVMIIWMALCWADVLYVNKSKRYTIRR